MSWQRAKKIAARYAVRLGLPPRLDGVSILLADYPDEETHSFLKVGQQWSLEFHRMVNRALLREIESRGGRATFVTITLPDYFDWITRHSLENTPANRAQFIVWKTAPDLKPTPVHEHPTG